MRTRNTFDLDAQRIIFHDGVRVFSIAELFELVLMALDSRSLLVLQKV